MWRNYQDLKRVPQWPLVWEGFYMFCSASQDEDETEVALNRCPTSFGSFKGEFPLVGGVF